MIPVDKIVSSVGFTPASPQDVREGLVGYVTCAFADMLLLDGITLRMTEAGRPALSFPSRTDRQGRKHPFIRPLDDSARKAVEAAVFDALGIGHEEGM